MVTARDLKVLDFIQKNPCKSDTLQKMFYPSYRVAMKRLETLVDDGYCKRCRVCVNDKYFYYMGRKPKTIEHLDLTAKSILWVQNQGYEVITFKREVKLDGARPDAVIGIKKGEEYGVLMVEIERYNNTLKKKIALYEKIRKQQQYFKTFKILYVCDKSVTSDKVKVINVNTKDFIKGC